MAHHQVVIVGAGPTGLLLAGDLAQAGIDVAILEKRDRQSNLTRAFAVHARTLEVLDMRGIADDLVALGNPAPRLRLTDRVAIDLSRLPSRFPFVLVTPQYHTEKVLRRRAIEAGAVIEPGHRVVSLTQDGDGVRLTVETADGHREETADWVVGTDGAHSTVRTSLDIAFDGELVAPAMILADVRFDEPPPHPPQVNANAAGFAFIAEFGDGYHRIVCRANGDDRSDEVPVTEAEIRDLLTAVFGSDFGMSEIRWTSRFHSDERQAARYRDGRVFLAGDAAHVHTPAGGQGMNIGIQDAANLGWKLAAAVDGWAPPDLLDSYEAERHPIGTDVMRGSGRLFRLGTLRSAPSRLLRNVGLAAALNVPPIRRRAAETVSGIGTRLPGGDGDIGGRAPDVQLTGPVPRLYEALRAGRFVLMTPEDSGVRPSPEAADHTVVVHPRLAAVPTMLIRPDGYIAWSRRQPDSIDPQWLPMDWRPLTG
ncbi:2-polyprenyl-6-methoxyphenol hydroxylase-like FAD-dependent oxidoreductase [Stackebrandtia endophytica]|uniref:2-polyprenyl-6-methoxyphenol hydroxylase-like FAD-dependent oxidoreductase n=1 Tax=Stackebrandtia endophytica TaxID=1496996 RepID=A0A543ATP2_9ACTN|nr:FAD-dependent monooxygenase [Stackebrandtia endophytica]TQL75957.1 2-polyprenyl-6-methoxyphenol hydroxylase-like FAD-dependent oxidoreductase [Stackebrandtia endophytica]